MSKYYKISCTLFVHQQVVDRLRGLGMPWLSQYIGGTPYGPNCVNIWSWSRTSNIESVLPLVLDDQYSKVHAYDSLEDALGAGLTVEIIEHLHDMTE